MSEKVERAEELRVAQAPNRKGVWSRSQNPRERAMSGPRFEQTIMELQVSSKQQTMGRRTRGNREWLSMRWTLIEYCSQLRKLLST